MDVDIEPIRKKSIINSKGVSYPDFRATLKPRYGIVWLHIALGYFALVLSAAAIAIVQTKAPALFWLNIPAGGLLIGYWIAYIHLFIHEAAHYNIAANRETNDTLANIFIGLLIGLEIKFYRVIHFDHHRYLGTSQDTENTYFNALNFRFLFESLTGIRVLRVMANRSKKIADNPSLSKEIIRNNKIMFLVGMLLNLVFATAMFLLGYWQLSIAWMGGLLIIFPLFGSIRQLLEHRSEYAKSSVDYTKVAPPKTTRMFGSGPLSSTMGGAGFNRHLLHHWDPQVSYTRLKDIEEFLRDTSVNEAMQQSMNTYPGIFYKLYNK